jgi:hypothetical protein
MLGKRGHLQELGCAVASSFLVNTSMMQRVYACQLVRSKTAPRSRSICSRVCMEVTTLCACEHPDFRGKRHILALVEWDVPSELSVCLSREFSGPEVPIAHSCSGHRFEEQTADNSHPQMWQVGDDT